ncbi:MAG: ribonuclease HI family protein [Candidatus Dependentiae bacterium]|nr:ribonuclease HI family protein [Candidatus Dependentiae bacterium]
MKQLELFAKDATQKKAPEGREAALWQLFVDGAARNNPGPAGAGICLCKDRIECACEGYFLGVCTNNEAEYQAMVLGLLLARQHVAAGERLAISSDSELLVRQLTGRYRVKKPELRIWYARAQKLLKFFTYTISHVRRENNMRADELANHGIDRKRAVPPQLQQEMLAL